MNAGSLKIESERYIGMRIREENMDFSELFCSVLFTDMAGKAIGKMELRKIRA